MTNPVHLIVIPQQEDGLQGVLKPLHMRYAQRINRRQGWSGHLWQGRFFPSPLDEAYLWFCVRYVERNPVRAGMVEQAEDYPWSSSVAHCGLKKDPLLVARHSKHWRAFELLENWQVGYARAMTKNGLRLCAEIFRKICFVDPIVLMIGWKELLKGRCIFDPSGDIIKGSVPVFQDFCTVNFVDRIPSPRTFPSWDSMKVANKLDNVPWYGLYK